MKATVPLVFLLLSLTGCAKNVQPYVPRDGLVSDLDSLVYDALIASEAIIAEASRQRSDGTLGRNVRTAVIRLIPIHNATNIAWKIYRAVYGTPDQTQAEVQLVELLQILSEQLNEIDRITRHDPLDL